MVPKPEARSWLDTLFKRNTTNSSAPASFSGEHGYASPGGHTYEPPRVERFREMTSATSDPLEPPSDIEFQHLALPGDLPDFLETHYIDPPPVSNYVMNTSAPSRNDQWEPAGRIIAHDDQYRILQGIGFTRLDGYTNSSDSSSRKQTATTKVTNSSLPDNQGAASSIERENETTEGPSSIALAPISPTQRFQPTDHSFSSSSNDDLHITVDSLAPRIPYHPFLSPASIRTNESPLLGASSLPSPLATLEMNHVDSTLMPPTSSSPGHDMNLKTTKAPDTATFESAAHYITTKRTCTLNLVCYRSGNKGCERYQIQTAKRSRFNSDEEFNEFVKNTPDLIINDEQFFNALRDVYLAKMCSLWRRAVFLKTLGCIRLLP